MLVKSDSPIARPVRRFIGEAALALYGSAGRLAGPIAGAMLDRRQKRGKEDPECRGERFGRASRPRPAGALVWVHAASVGETVTSLPVVERLAARGPSVLLTTGTVTAAQIAKARLPPMAFHQYGPIDTPGPVTRFLDHWRPNLVLFAESELWPTRVKEIGRRGLPLILINARMSERSFRSWRALAPVARSMMDRVELCLAQSPADAERLRALGASRVVVSGNLKFDVPAPSADADAVAAMRALIAGRFVLVAASTHPGEETAVIAAHAEIARGGAPLLTILAPRHPERGEALAAEIARAGLRFGRRSLGEAIGPQTDIYLADTIGEMGLWYRLADLAFLGGSMVPRGGQNPIEPAKLRVPVLHGSHVENFRDVYQALADARAVTRVEDSASLAAAVTRLLADRGARERLAREGYACVEQLAGALERTVEALEPYLSTPRRDHADVSIA